MLAQACLAATRKAPPNSGAFAVCRADKSGSARTAVDAADFIRHVLDRVGDKWSVLVVGTLEGGALRYSELVWAIPGISQRMLTLTLQQLAQDGIVSRTAYAEVPPRVEYELTALGRSLLNVVLGLAAWAVDHHKEISHNRESIVAAS